MLQQAQAGQSVGSRGLYSKRAVFKGLIYQGVTFLLHLVEEARQYIVT